MRSEISKKQRDVDLKQQGQAGPGPNTAFAPLSDAGTPTSRQSSEGDVLDGSADDFSSPRSRNGDVDGASKWRVAYEKVVRDNELLRTRGGDTLLVNQWRERYEVCMREKEDLVEKLKVYARVVESNTNGISSGKPLEQMYVDLRDEYKVCTTSSSTVAHFTCMLLDSSCCSVVHDIWVLALFAAAS